MTRRTSTKKKKGKKPYTTGELNRLIDTLCHPLYKQDQRLILVDFVLHGLVEKNPPQSVRKFIRYNLPPVVRKILNGLKSHPT